MKRFSSCFAIALVFAGLSLVHGADSLYVDYSDAPPPNLLLAHDVCILDLYTHADLAPGKKLGNRFLAYLSLVEIAPDAEYRKKVAALGVPEIAENEAWRSTIVDVADPRWKDFFLNTLAASAVGKGFDGFFLDTADSVELIAAKHPERSAEFADALVDLVESLRRRHPKAEIVINRGFPYFSSLKDQIDGLLVESVFATFDPADGTFRKVPSADTEYLCAQIAKYREAGIDAYVLDYVDPGDTAAAIRTEAKIRDIGAVPYLSTYDLEGTTSAGRIHIPRKIIVLFGGSPHSSGDTSTWPHFTTSHVMLQTPLEWMGYELDFHNVADGVPARAETGDYAGMIVDHSVQFPFEHEATFAKWLMERVEEGKKLLFLGSYGVSGFGPDEYFNPLGIGFDHREFPAQKVEITHLDEDYMNFEAAVRPIRWGFVGAAAPQSGQAFLSLAKPAKSGGKPIRYDPVYVADWGGALLEPYVVFNPAEDIQLSYVDPFKFLDRIWPGDLFPVPDTTTRDGLRLFYSHIDGDGFSSASWIDENKTCGEVLYEEVLKDISHPVTVSFIEAEIRAQLLVQNRIDQNRIEALARKILAIPHCEPASHSYSHPWNWSAAGQGPKLSRNLALNLRVNYPTLDLSREITGSLDYVRALAPQTKPPEIMLWSGDCLPSIAALRIATEAGYQNMNGGYTILSNQFPGLTNVTPKGIFWGGYLQVYASNQNEYFYTNQWQGPYYGGFAKVIETFEKTELPRRLKPVNVYYHFYSAGRPAALKAVKKVYSWCAERDLHALTASEYSAIVSDSYQTRIFKIGHRRWAVVNGGICRTFRLPASAGYPDIPACRGVTGFNRGKDWTHVHTDGSQRCVIAMQDRPPNRPYIATSTAPIAVESLTPNKVRVQVGKRSTQLRLEGFDPRLALEVRVMPGDERWSATPAPDGSMELDLAGESLLEIVY